MSPPATLGEQCRTRQRKVLRVGIVGHEFMGRMHAHAWSVAARLFDLPVHPRLTMIAGRDAARAAAASAALGIAQSTDDWRQLVSSSEVDAVVVAVPGSLHEEVCLRALENGKHVICEKPLANDPEAARRMVKADTAPGIIAAVGFNYRHLPAIAFARSLIEKGRIGTIRHVDARFLQDWLSSPDIPFSWRLDRTTAGSGALGDLGSHLVDLVQYLTDDRITQVGAQTRTVIPTRADAGTGEPVTVTVDDVALFTGELSSGALAAFQVSRVAPGHKVGLEIEVFGSGGSLRFDFQDLNTLRVHNEVEGLSGYTDLPVTGAGTPFGEGWWPAGHGLGYDAGFVHQCVLFASSVADGVRDPRLASFPQGLAVQHVVDAAVKSAAHGGGFVDVKQEGIEE